uniref:Uncharacterized protein n=1 Tax=Arcella intermedia TaxID=1963864 RepID=A0A6B2LLU8_9EUKA
MGVVMLGSGGVGKSAFVMRFLTDKFVPDYDPTIENSYRGKVTLEGKEIIIDILDTAGMEDTTRDQYISLGQFFIFMFSITDRSSFEEFEAAHCSIKKFFPEGSVFPMMMVGCKGDLDGERKVSLAEIEQKAKQYNLGYVETSALTGLNVKSAMDAAIKYYITQIQPSKPKKK